MRIAIYTRPTQAYGILIIIEHLIAASNNMGVPCRHITSLQDAVPDEVVIPYGTLETVEMIERGKKPILSLLVDAISLGAKNKVCFYTRVGHIWHKDYIGSFLRFIKWHFLDKKIVNNTDCIMLVSANDGEYLKRFNPDANIMVCPNGVNNAVLKPHIPSEKFRLGILSSWSNENTYEENNWFVQKYFKRYAKTHSGVELILAGRGRLIERLQGLPHVSVMGEVDDLADFFANIDLFVAVNPKGCGILNRCLDAFVYQVPVIGCKGAFSGFTYMKDSFLSFNTYQQFVEATERLKNDVNLRQTLVENALREVEKNNDWEKNLGGLIDKICELVEGKPLLK